MAKLPKIPGSSATRAWFLWVAMCILLTVGMLSTLLDLLAVAPAQRVQAQKLEQRIMIDAKSGKILGPQVPTASQPAPITPDTVPKIIPTPEPAPSPEAAATPPTPEPAPSPEAAATPPAFDVGEVSPAPAARAVPDPAAASDDNAPILSSTKDDANALISTVGKESLITAPAPEVSEKTPEGILPTRSKNQTTPAQIYSRHFAPQPKTFPLHFVVLGVGFSTETLALARQLPPEVSFSFSPYAPHLSKALEASRNDGHEAWLDLPVQSVGYPQNDPGPLGLISSLPKEEFTKRLKKILIAAPGIVGVVLPREESLSAEPNVFTDLLDTLDKRGLLMLSTHPKRRIQELGTKAGLRDIIVRSDVMLDDVPSEAAIKSKLAGILEQTKTRGRLVVTLRAQPQTLQLLSQWLKTNALQDVVLAPLSATLLKDAPPPSPAPATHGAEEGKKKTDKHAG
ncbi:MAG: divergent polysaccharide deacetylase family protein [Alphaproteobacteria bacterium]